SSPWVNPFAVPSGLQPICGGDHTVTDLPRSSGVQLHVTSLPGGRLGREAYRFVDWLAAAGQTWWQVLPFGRPDRYRSPYKGRPAHGRRGAPPPRAALGGRAAGPGEVAVRPGAHRPLRRLGFLPGGPRRGAARRVAVLAARAGPARVRGGGSRVGRCRACGPG